MLAIPAWINPLLPKLLFALAYLAFAVWLIKDCGKGRQRSRLGGLVLLVWLFNPYLWVEIACFGHFDILVGLCCVAAVAARADGRDVLSAVSLGLGVLIKFMPIVLLPFLILDRQRFRFRLLAAAVGVIAAGFLISLLIWGTSTFRPMFFAAGRTSQHLSIYRFLQGKNSPLQTHRIPRESRRLGQADPAPRALAGMDMEPPEGDRPRGLGRPGDPGHGHPLPGWFSAVSDGALRAGLVLVDPAWSESTEIEPWSASRWVATSAGLRPSTSSSLSSDIDELHMQEWIGLPTFILEFGLLAAIVQSANGTEANPGSGAGNSRPWQLRADFGHEPTISQARRDAFRSGFLLTRVQSLA